jgi:hypothetical protein
VPSPLPLHPPLRQCKAMSQPGMQVGGHPVVHQQQRHHLPPRRTGSSAGKLDSTATPPEGS